MKFFKPFPHPLPPVIPDYTVRITDFGAVADGKTPATEAIRRAIEDASAHGGGHVVVPAGVYLTGAVHLKSRIDLHLERGAELLFSADPDDYLPLVFTRIEGIRCYNYSPLLYAYECEDLSVTGEGKLNGQGEKWWPTALENRTGIEDLLRQGAEGTPVEERRYGDFQKWGLRPYFLQFVYCKNILIEGVRFIHSPFWCVAPLFSENILIRGVSWFSSRKGINTDSVDFDSCRNCLMENCHVDSSSDDGVCAKSGKDRDGREAGVPTVNVEVRNCRFDCGGCGVVVGSETSGGIDNVWFHDCEINESRQAIHVKSAAGRGSYVRNVDFDNIRAGRATGGIVLSTHYFMKEGDALTEMPEVYNISLENCSVEKSYHGLNVTGFQYHPLREIYLKNIDIGAWERPMTVEWVEGIHMENVHATHHERYEWRELIEPIPYHD